MMKCLKFLLGALLLSAGLQAVVVNGFPQQCALASERAPMDGHMLRLGHIAYTPYGWSFLFPDRQGVEALERVNVADNVGLIGQNPSANPGDSIRLDTPSGAFVVAQIFVGDPNVEPVVTCVSNVMAVNAFDPTIYGADFAWLSKELLWQLLDIRTYDITWNWQAQWGSKIQEIRNQFKGFNTGKAEPVRPSQGGAGHAAHDGQSPATAEQSHGSGGGAHPQTQHGGGQSSGATSPQQYGKQNVQKSGGTHGSGGKSGHRRGASR